MHDDAHAEDNVERSAAARVHVFSSLLVSNAPVGGRSGSADQSVVAKDVSVNVDPSRSLMQIDRRHRNCHAKVNNISRRRRCLRC